MIINTNCKCKFAGYGKFWFSNQHPWISGLDFFKNLLYGEKCFNTFDPSHFRRLNSTSGAVANQLKVYQLAVRAASRNMRPILSQILPEKINRLEMVRNLIGA